MKNAIVYIVYKLVAFSSISSHLSLAQFIYLFVYLFIILPDLNSIVKMNIIARV